MGINGGLSHPGVVGSLKPEPTTPGYPLAPLCGGFGRTHE
jgi:hypothetical protein